MSLEVLKEKSSEIGCFLIISAFYFGVVDHLLSNPITEWSFMWNSTPTMAKLTDFEQFKEQGDNGVTYLTTEYAYTYKVNGKKYEDAGSHSTSSPFADYDSPDRKIRIRYLNNNPKVSRPMAVDDSKVRYYFFLLLHIVCYVGIPIFVIKKGLSSISN